MATVWIPPLMRELTGGLERVVVPGEKVRDLDGALKALMNPTVVGLLEATGGDLRQMIIDKVTPSLTASLATRMAERLLEEGIYVVGFSYPVVPEGQARIRVQMSAAHTQEQLERAGAAFATVGRELGVIQ